MDAPSWDVVCADSLLHLKTLPDNSIDSIVTDPPYELGFMGKQWDASGIAYNIELWSEALRVLKPGGHLLAFGGTRTYHRMTVAIEDAGFEIRDCIQWLYGSGFPKSLNVSKAIDKAQGVEPSGYTPNPAERSGNGDGATTSTGWAKPSRPPKPIATGDDAQQWEGWGTALKPANEPIVVARKPLALKTVAAQVLDTGTGALNIDGCRVATDDNLNGGAYAESGTERADGWGMQRAGAGEFQAPAGRWPANVILDPEAAAVLDEQSGVSKSQSGGRSTRGSDSTLNERGGTFTPGRDIARTGHDDKGGASRFFYVAKPSKRERNAGLAGFEEKAAGRSNAGRNGNRSGEQPRANVHPTVKPINLMRYLCRMVTPPGGTVLDPFTGSGTTGCAAVLEGFGFLGIEREAEYAQLARARVSHHLPEQEQAA